MCRSVVSGCAVLVVGAAFLAAQNADTKPEESAMKMPEPQKEHDWLERFVGQWDSEVEIFMEPGKPPERLKGSENIRTIGGFWILGESTGSFGDRPFTGLLTLGYDPGKKKYVGTWVDSMTSYLWTYEGNVDDTGKVLTLMTEGPAPHAPGGKLAKFKEVTEFKNKDHKVFTSSMAQPDGSWSMIMRINSRRK